MTHVFLAILVSIMLAINQTHSHFVSSIYNQHNPNKLIELSSLDRKIIAQTLFKHNQKEYFESNTNSECKTKYNDIEVAHDEISLSLKAYLAPVVLKATAVEKIYKNAELSILFEVKKILKSVEKTDLSSHVLVNNVNSCGKIFQAKLNSTYILLLNKHQELNINTNNKMPYFTHLIRLNESNKLSDQTVIIKRTRIAVFISVPILSLFALPLDLQSGIEAYANIEGEIEQTLISNAYEKPTLNIEKNIHIVYRNQKKTSLECFYHGTPAPLVYWMRRVNSTSSQFELISPKNNSNFNIVNHKNR
jgi:hypothetical protein